MEVAEARMKANKKIVNFVINCNEGANKPVCQSVDVRSYPIVVAWYKGNFVQMPEKRGTGVEISAFCTTACATLMA